MKNTWKKALLPIAILGVSTFGFIGIKASESQPEKKEAEDTRPLVAVEAAHAGDFQVVLSSTGEVIPVESTNLSAQVSGEVVKWHANFVEGGLVRRGEVLFEIETATYQANLLQAEASLAQAEATLMEEQATANVRADEAKRQPRKKHSDLYLRKPQVISAKAAVKSAKAALKRAKRDLANCKVRSPYDALVVNRNLGRGQYISAGQQISLLHNIESAQVKMPIAGFDAPFLPDVLSGTPVRVSFSIGGLLERTGNISRDIGVVDSATRMTSLVVTIDDPYSLEGNQPVLKFGSFVTTSFPGQTLHSVYKVPQSLVNNKTVWTVDDTAHLTPKSVSILRDEGDYFLISAGLQEQDQIVMTPPEFPQAGMEVRISEQDVTASVGQL